MFGYNAKRKYLDASHRFSTIVPVAQHGGQSENLGDPATVFPRSSSIVKIRCAISTSAT